MAGLYAAATAVTAADGEGRFDATIAEGWDVAGNANGGYLLALASRALVAATGRPDPITVTAHYLAPGRSGPVAVETAIIRTGRRFSTATATVSAGDRPLLTVLATLGDLNETEGPELVLAGPPDLPPPEDCPAVTPGRPFPPAIMAKVELRLHPDDGGFFDGRRSGEARMRGWFRLRDDEPLDTVGLALAVDVFPPTIFNTPLPVAWVPTLELTVHARAVPAPGWLACTFGTRFVSGGFLESDGEVWDGTGRLVAQSRQLALVPRPSAG